MYSQQQGIPNNNNVHQQPYNSNMQQQQQQQPYMQQQQPNFYAQQQQPYMQPQQQPMGHAPQQQQQFYQQQQLQQQQQFQQQQAMYPNSTYGMQPGFQQQRQPQMVQNNHVWQQQQQQPQQHPSQQASFANNNQQQRGMRWMRPPYVDPQTNIIYDADNAEYEGWLTKQSMWLKEWRRRYFILKGSKLFFSKNEHSAPHGMMDLALCTTVKSADLKSKKRHSFEISTPETCYLLYADTESEKDDWIGRVGKAIVRCSRTYYQGSGAAANQTSAPGGHEGNVDDDDDIYTNDDPNNPYFND